MACKGTDDEEQVSEIVGLFVRLPGDIRRRIDLGSLRAGGASWLLLVSEDSELTEEGQVDYDEGHGDLRAGSVGNPVPTTSSS